VLFQLQALKYSNKYFVTNIKDLYYLLYLALFNMPKEDFIIITLTENVSALLLSEYYWPIHSCLKSLNHRIRA